MKNHEQKILILAVWMSVSSGTIAQQAAVGSDKYPPLTTFAAQQDQAQLMQQLGIKKLQSRN
jgi:hypothetical protein